MNNSLVITDCHFDINLNVLPGMPKGQQAELITRMKFWLDNCLENCIIMSMSSIVNTSWLEHVENPVMFAPSEPNDFLVQVMVHAKLHAIGAGLVNIAGTHMISDSSNGFGIWFEGDPDELLPLQKDWMGDRCFFELPWWHRGDAGMIDVVAGPEDDIKQKPDIIVDWHVIKPSQEPDADTKTAEIIRPNFKPRIITDD